MLLPNYQYMYDVSTIIKQMIESPNVYAHPVHTINVRQIGSRMSAKTIQDLKYVVELGFLPNISIKTDI